MKHILKIILFFSFPLLLNAQGGNETYQFLKFPTSARINSLGGHNVSLVEKDPSTVFHNPGLLGGEMDGMINVNFLNYFADIKVGSAVFTKAFGERSSWGIGMTYMNYGTVKETTIDDVELGTFSMQDVSLQAFYAYDLSEKWRGGLTFKGLYSSIADYTSFGIAVDAGLSYFDTDRDYSFGIALKNIGVQLKAYDEERQSIPWDLQMGITKRLAHAPLRVSLTGMYLNKWKFDYVDNTSEKTNNNFFETALKHLVIGVEFIPSDNFWIGVGVNPKTNMDMKLTSGNKMGGFSLGGGVKISRFNVGASVSRFHPSATSLLISLTMNLNDNL
jgi:hypothetical protein